MLCRLVAPDLTVLRTVHTVEIEYEQAGAELAAPKKKELKNVRVESFSTYLTTVSVVSWWWDNSRSVVCV